MADISITLDDSEVRALLRNGRAGLNRAFAGGINDATALLLRDLQTYPPQRSGSSYQRTGTLRRSWSREISGVGLAMRAIVGSNENIATYNRLVQDSTRQAPIHRDLWTNTVQAVLMRRERQIQDMFEARIRQELNHV